jgi:hypothetical protein
MEPILIFDANSDNSKNVFRIFVTSVGYNLMGIRSKEETKACHSALFLSISIPAASNCLLNSSKPLAEVQSIFYAISIILSAELVFAVKSFSKSWLNAITTFSPPACKILDSISP